MKNIIKLVLLSSAFSLSSYASDEAKNVKLDENSVIAELDGSKLYLKEVLAHYKDFFEKQPGMQGKKFQDFDKSIQDNIIKGYVNSKILEKETKSQKIEDSKEFKSKLEEVKSQIAQQVMIDKILAEKVKEDDLKLEYEKAKKELEGKQEVKASHILVADEKTAKEVKQKLDKGTKFEEVAKKYSTDEGSKANGGSLGYFLKGQLVPEFEEKAFSMKKGEVSAPVKTQFGYHIIKVEDSRAVKVPTYEEVKPSLQNKMSREAIENYIAELSKKYNVKFTN
jgi:peptidylprolyl isomerase/peptidyl-prolyl cis-trans isomerase C